MISGLDVARLCVRSPSLKFVLVRLFPVALLQLLFPKLPFGVSAVDFLVMAHFWIGGVHKWDSP